MATVVALNAHPDDEALVMGGTLAMLAAEGHRVILLVCTDGMMRGDDEPDSQLRLKELRAAGEALGAAEVRWLGYADSGQGEQLYPDPPGRVRLVRAGVEEPAAAVAQIVREENAALLIGYDVNGGYHHRDHLAVHAIARRAAELTGVRLVEATLPRNFAVGITSAAARLRLASRELSRQAHTWYTPAEEITHRIDVRAHVAAKKRALSAHQSELGKSGLLARTLRLIIRLPTPTTQWLVGTEYFVDPSATGRSTRIL